MASLVHVAPRSPAFFGCAPGSEFEDISEDFTDGFQSRIALGTMIHAVFILTQLKVDAYDEGGEAMRNR